MTGLPLAGVRVLDLTWVVSGPQATRVLADLGAEVIKIEGRDRGDQTRAMTFNPRVFASRGMYFYFNRNKLGATLNLATPQGRAKFQELVMISDVVIENFSAHVMRRWGFDYAGLARINPAVIYVSMSGFGHSGPYEEYRSNGPTLQALSGQTFACGLPNMPSAGWGFSYMDHTAGYYGSLAALEALYYRNRTGQGQFIDLAQFEAACSLMGTSILDRSANGRSFRRPGMPAGNRSLYPPAAPHGVYRAAPGQSAVGNRQSCDEQGVVQTSDDQWVAIAVFDDEEWRRFRDAIGDPEWAADERYATLPGRLQHEDKLNRRIEEWTSRRSNEEVMQRLQATGIAAGMVQDPAQRADHDPQLRDRDHIASVRLNEGDECLRTDTLPMTITAVPHDQYRPAPEPAEHNAYVYAQLLGMSEGEIGSCWESGIF